MFLVLVVWISVDLLSKSYGQQTFLEDECRQLEFNSEHTFDGKRLKGHVIRTDNVTDNESCEIACFMEPNCVSYNFNNTPIENGKYNCELNNSTLNGQRDKLETNPEYVYCEAEDACLKSTCKNQATCQTGFTRKGYRCLCTSEYSGDFCQTDVDECSAESHKCSVDAVCTNTEGSYNCTCKPGYYGDGKNCQKFASSCKELYDQKISNEGKAHPLYMDNQLINVFCLMTAAHDGNGRCGEGGWTLALKTDGHKPTFAYNSTLWENKEPLNLSGGETGFDGNETKLPTYWNTPFSKICLGMKIGHQTKFIVVNKHANSLFSLIADGKYRSTLLGRNTWKKLLGSQASLQSYCDKEGFNAKSDESRYAKARIGILANNAGGNECQTCDSRIGFGTAGLHDDSNTCGNEASFESDNGDKHIKAMGYILVQ